MRDTIIFNESYYFSLLIGMVSVLFCLLVGPVWAATYYVSNTTGRDLNSGLSQQTPWRHHPWMSKATGEAVKCILQPGDSVLLKRGDVWYDYLTLRESGETGDSIITGAYGSGDLPRIICPTKKITSGWARVSGNMYRIQIPHTGEDVGWVWQEEMSPDSALQMRSDTNVSEGEFFFQYVDETRGYLYLYKKGGGSPNGTSIYYSSKKFVIDGFRTDVDFIRFENLELWGGNWGTIVIRGKGKGPHSNIELDHLMVRFSGCSESSIDPRRVSWGIKINRYSNCSITNCTILNSAGFGIHFFAVQDSIIAKNEVSYHSAGNGQWSAGIKIVGGKQNLKPLNIVVENNYIYKAMRARANGIWNDVKAHNVTIRYNKIYEARSGIFFESGSAHNSAYYNIIGNCRTGIKCGGKAGGAVYDNEIYNNLIVDAEFSFELLYDDKGSQTIKNNISFNPTQSHMVWNKDHFQNGDIDYNCYFPTMKNGFLVLRGEIPSLERQNKTFEEWQGLGYDPHSIVENPRFKNPKSGDFHLLDDSPCIDKGVRVGLARDREGSLVPRGCCPDIGPFEYSPVEPPKNLQIEAGLNNDGTVDENDLDLKTRIL